LRNKIYTYVGHSEQIHIAATITNASPGDPTRDPSGFTMQFDFPGLLSTCQQTRSEATALIYAQSTVNTLSGDAWYWLYSHFAHRLCARVTSIQISEIFANLMERETDQRMLDSQDVKVCALHLPCLERVHVVCQVVAGWPIGSGYFTEEAVKEWFGNEGLDVFFEGSWSKQYSCPDSLIERYDMLVDGE